jgi:ribosomal protein S16
MHFKVLPDSNNLFYNIAIADSKFPQYEQFIEKRDSYIALVENNVT